MQADGFSRGQTAVLVNPVTDSRDDSLRGSLTEGSV